MLERSSALAGIEPLELPGIRLTEAPEFSLLQVARPAKAGVAQLGKLPEHVGRAVVQGERTVMKIGPERYWVVASPESTLAQELHGKALITPLSSSRTRILIEGQHARNVLARSAPLDFHPQGFGVQAFAMTGIHHTPVLIHCIGEQAFHVYAMRTFAHSTWEWLADAAASC